MDTSQYKDYVLVSLFIKYVSDKYAGVPYAPITIPKGASFKDMVALKGKSDIGDQINKKIIAPLANANKLSDMPDFNDANELGTGKEMVDRLTNLIAIFENKALDFSKNRAEGDDILGDAYEYLMRHFAAESGKSKGQCESASNLDPTPVEHQVIEVEVELLISGVSDRRPTVTPAFSSKSPQVQCVMTGSPGVQVGCRFTCKRDESQFYTHGGFLPVYPTRHGIESRAGGSFQQRPRQLLASFIGGPR
jgi:hypothetical protein